MRAAISLALIITLWLGVSVLQAGDAIPSPWQGEDIGAPVLAGTASGNGAAFEIQGAGKDIWGTHDEFHFVHQALNSDGSIVARVDAEDSTDEWAKAGVMMRASLDPSAPFVMSIMAPKWGSHLQWRSSPGDEAAYTLGRNWITCPYWVRLVRQGGLVTAFSAPDNYGMPGAWQQIAEPKPLAGGTVEAGLVVTSHNAGALCTARFSHVRIMTPAGNQDPIVAQPASAPLVLGRLATLSVLGADDDGEANLTYTWSAVWSSAGDVTPAVVFTRNANHAARTTLARFAQPGAYILRAAIADAQGSTAYSDVAVTVLPESSPVSPACVEGVVAADPGTGSAHVGVDGHNLPIQVINETRLYFDVPLAERRPVLATLGSASSTSINAIAWAPTVVQGNTSIAIRAHDALLLRLQQGGRLHFGQGCGAWLPDLPLSAVDRLPQRFDEAGVYTVSGFDAHDEPVGTLTVSVTGVNFDGPVACEVGFRRDKGVEIAGPGNPVVFQSSDAALMPVSVKESTDYGVRLYLQPMFRGAHRLLARLGNHGAILATQEVDEFTVLASGLDNTVVNAETGMGMNSVTIKPLIRDLTLNQSMFAHRSTFAGGVTSQSSSTNDWSAEIDADGETIGVYRYALEIPATEDSYCYHYGFDQHSHHGTPASETKSVNGGQCKFTVTRLCLYEGDASGVLTITEAPENKKNHVHLHTASVLQSKATLAPDTHDCKAASSADWNPTCTLNGTPAGCYTVDIDGTPFEEKLCISRVDSVTVKVNGYDVHAYGFSFGVNITVAGKGLGCLQITQLIKANTTMSDLNGVAQTQAQILERYRGSDPVSLFSSDFVTDTGWAWSDLLETFDCTTVSALKTDRQVFNLENRRVDIDATHYGYEGRLAAITRNFKIQLRLKDQETVRFEKLWGYTWDNKNAEWQGHNTTRSDIGSGTFSNVVGIEGLP